MVRFRICHPRLLFYSCKCMCVCVCWGRRNIFSSRPHSSLIHSIYYTQPPPHPQTPSQILCSVWTYRGRNHERICYLQQHFMLSMIVVGTGLYRGGCVRVVHTRDCTLRSARWVFSFTKSSCIITSYRFLYTASSFASSVHYYSVCIHIVAPVFWLIYDQ